MAAEFDGWAIARAERSLAIVDVFMRAWGRRGVGL
jgi:hypothetical protein